MYYEYYTFGVHNLIMVFETLAASLYHHLTGNQYSTERKNPPASPY